MYHVFKVFKITTLYATWCHSKPLIPKQWSKAISSFQTVNSYGQYHYYGMWKLASDLFLGSEFIRLSILTTQPIYFLCVSSGKFRFRSLEIIKRLLVSAMFLLPQMCHIQTCASGWDVEWNCHFAVVDSPRAWRHRWDTPDLKKENIDLF